MLHLYELYKYTGTSTGECSLTVTNEARNCSHYYVSSEKMHCHLAKHVLKSGLQTFWFIAVSKVSEVSIYIAHLQKIFNATYEFS